MWTLYHAGIRAGVLLAAGALGACVEDTVPSDLDREALERRRSQAADDDTQAGGGGGAGGFGAAGGFGGAGGFGAGPGDAAPPLGCDQPSACELPFCADCNGSPDDGCETDLRTADDCGACGRSCGAAACQIVGTEAGAGGSPGVPPPEGTGVCEGEVVVGRAASTVFLSLTLGDPPQGPALAWQGEQMGGQNHDAQTWLLALSDGATPSPVGPQYSEPSAGGLTVADGFVTYNARTAVYRQALAGGEPAALWNVESPAGLHRTDQHIVGGNHTTQGFQLLRTGRTDAGLIELACLSGVFSLAAATPAGDLLLLGADGLWAQPASAPTFNSNGRCNPVAPARRLTEVQPRSATLGQATAPPEATPALAWTQATTDGPPGALDVWRAPLPGGLGAPLGEPIPVGHAAQPLTPLAPAGPPLLLADDTLYFVEAVVPAPLQPYQRVLVAVDAEGTRTRLAVVPAAILSLVADAHHVYWADAEAGIGRTRR